MSERHLGGETLLQKEARTRTQFRVAYFTAGTIGAGHLVRGLAIRRALERRNCSVTYRIFAPRSALAETITPSYVPVEIHARELRQPASAAASQLAASLEEFAPDLLLVDLFWAPLAYVTVGRCRAWLLIRSCPVKWLGTLAGFSFEPSRYGRVIAIEPTVAASLTDRIPPIVMANPTGVRGAWRIA